MMATHRKLRNAVGRWLSEERAGAEERAERGLRRVFTRLPMPEPSAGFAARVLARYGLTPACETAGDLTGYRARAALLLAGLGMAVAVVYLPSLLAAVWVGIQAWNPLEVASALLLGATQRLVEGVTLWRALTQIGELLARILESPRVLALLVGACLLSAGAFRLLQGLIVPERSRGHA